MDTSVEFDGGEWWAIPFDGSKDRSGVIFIPIRVHPIVGMTGGDEGTWPAATFAELMQEASEATMEQQQELFRRWLSMNTGRDRTADLSEYAATSVETATFKTRVQSGGRISIPDVEREALDIEEGEIVQAIVLPVNPSNGDSNVE